MSDTSAIDRERLADGMTWLARAIGVISLALPLGQLDEPWSLTAGIFGPLGAVAVVVGVWRITAATPRGPLTLPLRSLALAAVVLRVITEVGVLLGEVGAGVSVEDGDLGSVVSVSLTAWDGVAIATVAASFLGVIGLARHLQQSLEGVAADRWKQVLWAWVAALVLTPIAFATAAIELLLLTAAMVVLAGALLVLSLLATWRAAEDDELDATFEDRRRER